MRPENPEEHHEPRAELTPVSLGVTQDEFDAMSKRARKRARSKIEWEAGKKDRRKAEKARRKENKRRRIEAGLDGGGGGGGGGDDKKRPRRRGRDEVEADLATAPTIMIDVDFTELMSDKELTSLCKQLKECYSTVLRSEHPLNVVVVGCDDKLLRSLAKTCPQYEKWVGFKFEREPIDESKQPNMCYLTADSETVMDAYDNDAVYVIGGLVDRNRYKNMCRDKAHKAGFATAQFPISKHMDGNTRRVLTVNHVFSILDGVHGGRPWPDVLLEMMPARKGFQVKK